MTDPTKARFYYDGVNYVFERTPEGDQMVCEVRGIGAGLETRNANMLVAALNLADVTKSGNDIHSLFPQSRSVGNLSMTVGGASLLDHFAGCVLTGMFADPELTLSEDKIAQLCYDQAEAMLRKRALRVKS